VGSGFGTFEEIYRIYEPREALMQAYVNHAHNDWLEIFLEGGVAAIVAAIGFLMWFSLRSIAVWRSPGEDLSATDLLPRAATIAIVLILLFSLVEYPLRTTTISVIFAWYLGLLTTPVRSTAAHKRSANTNYHASHPARRRDGHRHRRPSPLPERATARR
jgi:O-antigen ligase